MPRTSLELFGGLRARRGEDDLRGFPTRKAAALTAFLAIENRVRHSRDSLAELLWNDVPAAQARHSLRQALSEVRSTLGDVLLTPEGTVRLDLKRVRVDVRYFEACVARGSVRALRTACALYRGDLLSGLSVPEVGFDVWQTNQRVRYRQMAIEAHQQYVQRLVDLGDSVGAMRLTLRLLGLEPLHEWGHQTMIALYAHRGQVGAAIQHYDAFARILQAELGIEPELKTQTLLRALVTARRRT